LVFFMIVLRSLRSPLGWLFKRLAVGVPYTPTCSSPLAALSGQPVTRCPSSSFFRPERPKLVSNTANSHIVSAAVVPSCIAPLCRPADKMSSRVKKTKSRSAASTLHSNHLLTAILSADEVLTMHPWSACASKGLDACEVSKTYSSRCAECVRAKRSNCNVLGVSPA